jgi:O-antigen ligase
MRINFSHFMQNYKEQANIVLFIMLFMGPLIALLGNAASDLWLVGFSLFYLTYWIAFGRITISQSAILSPITKRFDLIQSLVYLKNHHIWFIIAFLFWLWLIVTSLTSFWPIRALTESLPWIRFPLFALLLAHCLFYYSKARHAFMLGIWVGVMILLAVLLVERLQNPDALRLYGTWGQHPKPGWYLYGFGLILGVFALNKANGWRDSLWALVPIAIFVGAVATGEIYTTMSILLGFGTFIAFDRFKFSFLMLMGVGALLLIATLFITNPDLMHRFTSQAITRLPWLPSSDYRDAWFGGISVGLLNPLFGVGADNYDLFCKSFSIGQRMTDLHVAFCHPHPHQLYIQVFAETGLLGIVLFCLMALALLQKILTIKPILIMPVALMVVALWPISTFSEGFGQHKNFYLWLLIGVSLARIHADNTNIFQFENKFLQNLNIKKLFAFNRQ